MAAPLQHIRENAVLYAVAAFLAGYIEVSTMDRFTGSEATRLQARLDAVETVLADRPPKWLTEDLRELKRDVKDMQRELSAVREVVVELRAQRHDHGGQ